MSTIAEIARYTREAQAPRGLMSASCPHPRVQSSAPARRRRAPARNSQHDLRHEYASRLVERGVPLSQVRDLLGRASIVTTERYDNHTFAALQAAAGRLESGKSFTSPSQTRAASDVARPDSESAADRKVQQANSFKAGGPPGDRTRDTVIKSHVLYH